MERCLAQACTPLLEMICCWLFEGRLSSGAGDFFILSNPLPKGAWPPLSAECGPCYTLLC